MESVQQYCTRVRDNLNVIFTQLIREYERILTAKQPQEKAIIDQWLQKLRSSEASVKEMKIRNEILSYMVECGRRSSFDIEPFKTIPPSECSLEKLRYLLPADYKTRCSDKISEGPDSEKLRDTLNGLPNGGKIMMELPVPRAGTFSLLYMRPTKFA